MEEGGGEEDYPELLSDFEPSTTPKKSDFKLRLTTSLRTLPPNTAKLLYCGCGYLCHRKGLLWMTQMLMEPPLINSHPWAWSNWQSMPQPWEMLWTTVLKEMVKGKWQEEGGRKTSTTPRATSSISHPESGTYSTTTATPSAFRPEWGTRQPSAEEAWATN